MNVDVEKVKLKEEFNKLDAFIKHHEDLYYAGNPVITDQQYDLAVDITSRLKEIAKSLGVIKEK